MIVYKKKIKKLKKIEGYKIILEKISMKSMKLVKWIVDINRLILESKMLDFFLFIFVIDDLLDR